MTEQSQQLKFENIDLEEKLASMIVEIKNSKKNEEDKALEIKNLQDRLEQLQGVQSEYEKKFSEIDNAYNQLAQFSVGANDNYVNDNHIEIKKVHDDLISRVFSLEKNPKSESFSFTDRQVKSLWEQKNVFVGNDASAGLAIREEQFDGTPRYIRDPKLTDFTTNIIASSKSSLLIDYGIVTWSAYPETASIVPTSPIDLKEVKLNVGIHALSTRISKEYLSNPVQIRGYSSPIDYIMSQYANYIGEYVGNLIINGNGSQFYKGILDYSAWSGSTVEFGKLQHKVSSVSQSFNYNDLIDMTTLTRTDGLANSISNSSVWIMHPLTFGVVRKLTDLQGRYMQDPRDTTILGRPVILSSAMPNIVTTPSSGAKAIIYGDLSDYVIGRLQGLELLIDPYSLSLSKQTQLVATTMSGGVLQGFEKLKVLVTQ